MSLGRSVAVGMLGAFLTMGVEIESIDMDNYVLTISVPKDSYEYHKETNKAYKDPESLAKRLKTIFIDMGIFPKECTVRYRVKDVIWTKEMGENNYNQHFHKISSLMNGGFNL